MRATNVLMLIPNVPTPSRGSVGCEVISLSITIIIIIIIEALEINS